MKCRYSYCKNNNSVDKDKAIKEGNSYYCPECYKEKQLKQQIEEFYLSNMPSSTLQLLRKVIKQLIHEKNFSAEYVLYVLKYIKINNKPINNPFGLINYCNNGYLLDEWKKSKTKEEYKKIKDTFKNENTNEEKVEFNFKVENTSWLKIL